MEKREDLQNSLLSGITRFEDRLVHLRNKSKKLSWYRLALFFISLILFFYFFFTGSSIPLYLTVFLFFIVFGILTGIHNKIERGIRKNIIWTRIKKLHLSRMNLKWKELPPSLFSPDESHPYEYDLSITGEYSLHRLMNTSASFEGSRLLREWLTAYQPDYDVIKFRQSIVGELKELGRFRDKLTLFSNLMSKFELKGTKILEWINTPSEKENIKKVLLILSFLIPVNIILFTLYILNILPPYFYISLLLYVSVYWLNGKFTKGLFSELLDIEEEFGKFSVIFDFLERYPYRKNSSLEKFCSVFITHSPSGDFKKIKTLANAVSITRNPLAALFLNAAFPYNFFLAYRMEKIKSGVKKDLPEWLDRWYNLEAYNSLSNYAWLNPGSTFPELNKEVSFFKAEEVFHPMIPYNNNIANSFSVLTKGEVFIITGSNMSGKSTFLKTLGINLAMAYAGGVVNAAKLNTSLFRIFCCIKISDSVIDGISYFYAEVKRLKHLLSELRNNQNYPVFFLIDEIFKGTNNVERLSGSRSYIKETIKLNGTGFVSTHDLELSKLEDEIPSVKNYHFREEAVAGKMIFDYKLRQGPCPTTNALKIMKSEGLPVE
jgi:hypothetical protein